MDLIDADGEGRSTLSNVNEVWVGATVSFIVVHVVHFELHLRRLSFYGGFRRAWVKWLSLDECKPVHFDAFV
jgi:hypothetical protein